MSKLFSGLWNQILKPMFRRPPRRQVAALCWREPASAPGSAPEVLLISSRGTGRWILPKGWPIRGLDLPRSALQEAWEEAGVIPVDAPAVPVGRFASRKVSDSGLAEPSEVAVFSAQVLALADDYPELGQRTRRWASPAEAAELVDEAGLAELILEFGRNHRSGSRAAG